MNLTWLLFPLLFGLSFAAPMDKDPITEFAKLYNNLPDSDKDFYPDYLEPEDLVSLPEDQLLRHYAVIHVIFPRFYEMLHLAFTQIIAHYNGSAQGKEFVELYYSSINEMSIPSDESYNVFATKIHKKWRELNDKVKAELTETFGGLGKIRTRTQDDFYQKLLSLPKDRLKVFLSYVNYPMLQEMIFQLAGVFDKNNTDLKPILKLIYQNMALRHQSGLSDEGREFVQWYYDLAENQSDSSDKSLKSYREKVRARWSQLDKSTQANIQDYEPDIAFYIEQRPDASNLSNTDKALKLLPPARQATFLKYWKIRTNMFEEQKIRFYAKLHHTEPDFYQIAKLSFAEKIVNVHVSKKAAKFFEIYQNLMDFMPDDSDASYNTFIEAAKSEWSKLEKETQTQIDEKFPGMERLLGKLTFDRALKQLPAVQQKLYESFQRESGSNVERQIRLLAQMHKNNPELYRVAQISRQENVDKFDGGAKARKFLEYYHARVDQMRSGSDKEFDSYVRDVNAKFRSLSKLTQWQLLAKCALFGGVLRSN